MGPRHPSPGLDGSSLSSAGFSFYLVGKPRMFLLSTQSVGRSRSNFKTNTSDPNTLDSSFCPRAATHTQPEATQKGLPDTQLLSFPLYCSSTELEVGLDLQLRAERRLGGGGTPPGWEGKQIRGKHQKGLTGDGHRDTRRHQPHHLG